DFHHADTAFGGDHRQVWRQARHLSDAAKVRFANDAYRIADFDSSARFAWVADHSCALLPGGQRHDDFGTDDARPDLRRAGDAGLPAVELPQEFERFAGHRNTSEPFGQA